MLTRLYSFLLRRHFPRDSFDEMLDTFTDARENARAQGVIAYSRFALRELAGLLQRPVRRPNRSRWMLSGAVAGAAIAATAAFTIPERYTSSATLQISTASIPDKYFGASARQDLQELVRNQVVPLLSRASLTNMIQTYDLYRDKRMRLPMEDILEAMRRDISIYAGRENTIQMAFTYSNPRVTQKVTMDLVKRMMDGSIGERRERLVSTVTFLNERAEASAKQWMSLLAATRKLSPADPQAERAALDLELARREYQSPRESVADAKMAEAAATWTQQASLSLLDLPSFPERNQLNRTAIIGGGALAGAIAGLLITLYRSLRSSPIAFPAIASGR